MGSADESWLRVLARAVGEGDEHTDISKTVLFALGLRAVYHIVVGSRLGLWDALAGSPDTPDGLAARLRLRPSAVGAWCELGCLLEYLQVDEAGRLRVPPTVQDMLCRPGSPSYVTPFLSLLADNMHDAAALYPDVFRGGGRVLRHERAGAAAAVAVRDMSRLSNREFLDSVLPAISEAQEILARPTDVLEVGCGAAELLIELARRYERPRFHGIDFDPHAIALARKAIASAGLDDRVTVSHGDALHCRWKGPFDLVLMIGLLHEIEPKSLAALAGKCSRHLAPRGVLVVRDFPRPASLQEARRRAYAQAITIGWMEIAEHGRCLTTAEQEDFMRRVGLRNVRHYPLQLPTGTFDACLAGVRS